MNGTSRASNPIDLLEALALQNPDPEGHGGKSRPISSPQTASESSPAPQESGTAPRFKSIEIKPMVMPEEVELGSQHGCSQRSVD
ncbi:hypothetical protein IFO71_16930 [Pseudoxanthomonas sp. CAU 1598]|uniref:Uncharacterized protein n=1 Tax=Pseudomarimonas arenosa TaxID=2774145 RepID=A0AAW3ZMS5_9GAMM|nr:hypothetical protein [Pseudomarimonas arenosa]